MRAPCERVLRDDVDRCRLQLDEIRIGIEIDFRAPVNLGDEIEIAVRATRFGDKSFDLDYVLRVGGQIVAEAKSVLVGYDYGSGETIAIPDDWRERLAA